MDKNQRLITSEWISVSLLCTLLTVYVTISSVFSTSTIPIDEIGIPITIQRETFVSVEVSGAVKFPNTYSFPKGTEIEKVIAKAQPLPDADLSKINIGKQLTRKRKLVVPVKTIKRSRKKK